MTHEELRKIRKEQGLTIEQLAAKLNTNKLTVRNWLYKEQHKIPKIVELLLREWGWYPKGEDK